MTLEFLTDKNFNHTSTQYGFFTRNGGVSTGIYESLNCGPGSSDKTEDVVENRQRVADTFSGNKKLITICQIHSNKVVIIENSNDLNPLPEGDALVTRSPDVILGVLTADCVPVLFADTENQIIGAAHAGWRGAFEGVLENTIQTMEGLGAKKESIRCIVGPCIAQNNYEVDNGFYENFISRSSENDIFFTASEKEKHHMFNLRAYVNKRLTQANITNIANVDVDTYANEQQFFSWRRSYHQGKTDYGRQVSAIALAE
jgi:YfiH family protein